MSIQIIILIVFGVISLWMLFNPLTKTKNNTPNPPINTNDETDQNPIGPGEIIIPGEMPEKPLPVNCQLAQFQPAPQDFFYVDCCGNPQKGEGFQPWEKRSPVAIDSNKPFFGMTLLDVVAEKDC